MRCSANEIFGLARKAGIGAGLDHGSAEELAVATVRLYAGGQPGLALLLDLLESPADAGELVAKACLIEAAGGEKTGPAKHAAMLAALLDRSPQPAGPFGVDEAHYETTDILARRCLVPASAASRVRGAGAATSDND